MYLQDESNQRQVVLCFQTRCGVAEVWPHSSSKFWIPAGWQLLPFCWLRNTDKHFFFFFLLFPAESLSWLLILVNSKMGSSQSVFLTVITKKAVLLIWRREARFGWDGLGGIIIHRIFTDVSKICQLQMKNVLIFFHNSPGQKPWKVSPKWSPFLTDKWSLFWRGPLEDCWQSSGLTQVLAPFCST